jgi:hypothetical protein
MSEGNQVNSLLDQHKAALNKYREWDEKVKQLLKGRRTQDLNPDDMEAYREASTNRDAAYDEMRHLERQLLDDIPGASTATLPRVRFNTPQRKETKPTKEEK